MNDIIIIIGAIILLLFIANKTLPIIQNKIILGDLTGNSFYKKLTDGNILYVEYLDEDLNKKYRIATKQDIEILIKLKYLL
jgi:hypothetical protein